MNLRILTQAGRCSFCIVMKINMVSPDLGPEE